MSNQISPLLIDFMSDILDHEDISHNIISDYIKIGKTQRSTFEIELAYNPTGRMEDAIFRLSFIEDKNKYLQEPVATGHWCAIIKAYREESNKQNN